MLGGKKSCLCWLLFSRLRPWEPLPPSCCSSLSQKNESNAQMLPCDCFKNAARQVRSKATPPQHSTIARQCSDIGLATGCAKPAGTAGRATTSTEEDFACGWCHSWHPLHWLRTLKFAEAVWAKPGVRGIVCIGCTTCTLCIGGCWTGTFFFEATPFPFPAAEATNDAADNDGYRDDDEDHEGSALFFLVCAAVIVLGNAKKALSQVFWLTFIADHFVVAAITIVI